MKKQGLFFPGYVQSLQISSFPIQFYWSHLKAQYFKIFNSLISFHFSRTYRDTKFLVLFHSMRKGSLPYIDFNIFTTWACVWVLTLLHCLVVWAFSFLGSHYCFLANHGGPFTVSLVFCISRALETAYHFSTFSWQIHWCLFYFLETCGPLFSLGWRTFLETTDLKNSFFFAGSTHNLNNVELLLIVFDFENWRLHVKKMCRPGTVYFS